MGLIPRLYGDNGFNQDSLLCLSGDSYNALLKLLPLLSYPTLYNDIQKASSLPEKLQSEIVNAMPISDIIAAINNVASSLPSQYILNQCCGGSSGDDGADAIDDTGGIIEDDFNDGIIEIVPDITGCQSANLVYWFMDKITDLAVSSSLAVSVLTPSVMAGYIAGALTALLQRIGLSAIVVSGAVVVGGNVVVSAGVILTLALGLKLGYVLLGDDWQELQDNLQDNKTDIICAIQGGDSAYLYENAFFNWAANIYVDLWFGIVKSCIAAIPPLLVTYGYELADVLIDDDFTDCSECASEGYTIASGIVVRDVNRLLSTDQSLPYHAHTGGGLWLFWESMGAMRRVKITLTNNTTSSQEVAGRFYTVENASYNSAGINQSGCWISAGQTKECAFTLGSGVYSFRIWESDSSLVWHCPRLELSETAS